MIVIEGKEMRLVHWKLVQNESIIFSLNSLEKYNQKYYASIMALQSLNDRRT